MIMSARLTPSEKLARTDGSKRAIKATHLAGDETLRQGQKIVVYDEQVPSDKVRWFGYGMENMPMGVARMYADLVASGDGSGAAGDAIEADLRLRLTDSTGDEIIASRELGDAGTLADAADDERTERPKLPALGPGGQGDRRLQVVVNADAASDGVQIDPSASSARFWYTQA